MRTILTAFTVLTVLAASASVAAQEQPAAPATQPAVVPVAPVAPVPAANGAAPRLPAHLEKKVKDGIDKGLGFLRRAWDASRPEAPAADHRTHWGHPGLTALALTAFYRSPRHYSNEDGPFIREPFEYLLSIQREDGAINDQPGLDNYITSVSMLALISSKEAEDKSRPESAASLQRVLDRAAAFLTKQQLDEDEGYRPDDKNYGGQGYGSSQRPDLSNTQLAIEALHDYGLPADSDYFKKALTFLSRCQNSSETNDLKSFKGEDGETYVPGNDGGSIYYPGRSEAVGGPVKNADGTQSLRSYGSMTYAAVKSMIYAGLSKDDPRVLAALDWIRSNYRLNENPHAGAQGLYYYYATFAKALQATGLDKIEDAELVSHNWRADAADAVLSRQRPDGSWVNQESDRWMEGNPVLVTAYAVLALEHLLEK